MQFCLLNYIKKCIIIVKVRCAMAKIKKDFLCNLIFKVLARGVVVLNKKDTEIRDNLADLPENFVIGLGVFPFGEYIYIVKENGKFFVSKIARNADLNVIFKNAKSAKKVMLARSSIAESFCRHDIIVKGDIALAMTLVRVINRAEKYLFPHFMTKRFLPKIKKQTCSVGVYCKIFFSKINKE